MKRRKQVVSIVLAIVLLTLVGFLSVSHRMDLGSRLLSLARRNQGQSEPRVIMAEEPVGNPDKPATSDRDRWKVEFPDFELRGRILRDNGQPVEGAEIDACEIGSSGECADFRSATAAEGGVYALKFPFARDGRRKITIEKPGFAITEARVVMKTAGIFERDYVLYEAAATLFGRISAGKLPLPGATVDISTASQHQVQVSGTVGAARPIGWSAMLLADNKGEFHADGLPAGQTVITVTVRGYRQKEPTPLVIMVLPGDNRIDIQMENAVSIAFDVIDSLGAAVLEAQAFADVTPRGIMAPADQSGRVTLELPPDVERFDCKILAPGYLLRALDVVTAAPPARVVLEEAPILRGVVVSQTGQVLPGAIIAASTVQAADRSGEHSFPLAEVTTDSRGEFGMRVGADRNVELSISREGYLPGRFWLEKVEERNDLRLVLKKPEAALHGFVVDPRGNPVRNFTVRLVPVELDLSRASSSILENARSGDPGVRGRFQTKDGSFSFPGLEAGRFRVIVTATTGRGAEPTQSDRERPEVLRGEQEIELRKGLDSEVTLKLEPYVRSR